jgi:hypothetical protein
VRRLPADPSSRLILAAMAVASATLVALGVAFAFGAFDSGTSGPPGSVSGDCRKYATANAKAANIHDPFIKASSASPFRPVRPSPARSPS